MTDSNTWRNIHDEFTKLEEEEIRLLQNRRGKQCLNANGDYSVLIMFTQEGHPFCVFPRQRSACGFWELSDGPDGDFQERFEVLETQAGVALGSPPGVRSLDFWLHSLFLFLKENKKCRPGMILGDTDEAGLMEYVCKSSATFCSRLERGALEQPQSAGAAGGSENEKDKKSQDRAREVKKVRGELTTLVGEITDRSKYKPAKKRHTEFLTFAAAEKVSPVDIAVHQLNGRQPPKKLSFQIVAALNDVAWATVKKDWGKYGIPTKKAHSSAKG